MSTILLLHASAGMGHQRAAQALAHALEQHPQTIIHIEDTLQYARPLFRRVYPELSVGIADRVPALWSYFYHHTDRHHASNSFLTHVRELSTAYGVNRLASLLDRVQPDAIVCTHFLPLEVLATLRHYGLPPISCIVTDYHAHHFWAYGGADCYFVPCEASRTDMINAGIPAAQVQVAGIPVDLSVTQPVDRLQVRNALGLPAWQQIVTLIGSGITIERVHGMVTALLEQRLPATLVVAVGRNKQLAARLAELEQTAGLALRVLGPQPSLDPLIGTSELVVSKAGGLITSEVLARGVPMLIPLPVAGQEQWNVAYVEQAGAGKGYTQTSDLAQAVAALLHDAPRRATMAAAARSIGRPDAATTIATRVLADASQGRRFEAPQLVAPSLATKRA